MAGEGGSDDFINGTHAIKDGASDDVDALHDIIGAEHEEVAAGGIAEHCGVGNEQRGASSEDRLKANEGAGDDGAVGVFEDGFDAERAGFGIHTIVGFVKSAGVRISLFVGEAQVDGDDGAAIFAGTLVVILEALFEELAFIQIEHGEDLVIIDDGGEKRGLGSADQLTFVDVDDADAAAGWGLDGGEFEIKLAGADSGFGEIELRFGGITLGLGTVELLLTACAGTHGILDSSESDFRETEVGLLCGGISFGLREGCFEGTRIDGEEKISGFDAAATLDVLLLEVALDAGADLNGLDASGAAGELECDGDFALDG